MKIILMEKEILWMYRRIINDVIRCEIEKIGVLENTVA